MKNFILLVMSMALFAHKLSAFDQIDLSNLGTGDSKLLVWVNPNLADLYLCYYTGQNELPEPYLFVNNIGINSLEILYPPHPGAIVGLRLQHCFPFDAHRVFIRQRIYAQKKKVIEGQSVKSTDVFEERSNLIVIGQANGVVSCKVVEEETADEIHHISNSDLFLGEIGNMIFYWNVNFKDTIVATETSTNRIFKWRIPGIYLANGVFRGEKSGYNCSVYREIHKFANATGEEAVINISIADAEISEPTSQP